MFKQEPSPLRCINVVRYGQPMPSCSGRRNGLSDPATPDDLLHRLASRTKLHRRSLPQGALEWKQLEVRWRKPDGLHLRYTLHGSHLWHALHGPHLWHASVPGRTRHHGPVGCRHLEPVGCRHHEPVGCRHHKPVAVGITNLLAVGITNLLAVGITNLFGCWHHEPTVGCGHHEPVGFWHHEPAVGCGHHKPVSCRHHEPVGCWHYEPAVGCGHHEPVGLGLTGPACSSPSLTSASEWVGLTFTWIVVDQVKRLTLNTTDLSIHGQRIAVSRPLPAR